MKSRQLILFSLFVSLLSGCFLGGEPTISKMTKSIVNGRLSSMTRSYHVNIFTKKSVIGFTSGDDPRPIWSWKSCSGTMLTNQTLVTAAHCFNSLSVLYPNRIRVYQGNNANADEGNLTFILASKVFLHPQVDLAIVDLVSPMAIANSFSSHSMPVWQNRSSSSYRNKTIYCYGFGSTTDVQHDADGAYDNLLRYTKMNFHRYSSNLLEIKPKINYGYPSFGDSGGGCFVVHNGRRHLLGVYIASRYNTTFKKTVLGQAVFLRDFCGWIGRGMC